MPTLAIITISTNGGAIIITANDGDVVGMSSKVRTIQILAIVFLDLFDNGEECTTIKLMSGDRLYIKPDNVQQIGLVTDLDTAPKIEAALIGLLGW